MEPENSQKKSELGIKDILLNIKNSLDGIYSVFCIDSDGLLINEVGLQATLGKDTSIILSSLIAGIQSNIDIIGKEIKSDTWISFISESNNYKLIVWPIDSIAFLGVLTNPFIDLEILKLIIKSATNKINNLLSKWSFTGIKNQLVEFKEINISTKDIDDFLNI